MKERRRAPGGGRKTLPQDHKRIQFTMMLAPDLYSFVEKQAGAGTRKEMNRWIEEQIRRLEIESRII